MIKILHNAYTYTDPIETAKENNCDAIELDVIWDKFTKVSHSFYPWPFKFLYEGYIKEWLHKIEKTGLKIAIDLKTYKKIGLNTLMCLFAMYPDIDFVMLNPAENWFTRGRRTTAKWYILNNYTGDNLKSIDNFEKVVYINRENRKKLIYKIFSFLG